MTNKPAWKMKQRLTLMPLAHVILEALPLLLAFELIRRGAYGPEITSIYICTTRVAKR
jgi:hypothetical protein